MINNKPIQTEDEYKTALKEIEQLFAKELNEIESKRLENLACLVQNFEDNTYPIPRPNFISKIQYYLQNRRLFPK